jgi:GntR family transcriptional regulator/MocR family aminotransferase
LDRLDWAENASSWIIEDNYDGEFRYGDQSISSLQGMDRSQSVIYVGTFSKVMYPALRVAYLVAPAGLVEPFRRARIQSDGYTATLPQVALAKFFDGGLFGSHVRRMRKVYAQRRASLLALLNQYLPEHLIVREAAPAGLHVTAVLRSHRPDTERVSRLTRQGIRPNPLSRYFIGTNRTSGLVLGFAHAGLGTRWRRGYPAAA